MIGIEELLNLARTERNSEPQEFYKGLFLGVLRDLWNNRTCPIMKHRLEEINKFEQQDPYGFIGYDIFIIEWQVYYDLYEEIKKKGTLPLISEVIEVPDRLTAPDDIAYRWEEINGDLEDVWQCNWKCREKVRVILQNIISAARSSLPLRNTDGRHGGIPIMTKEKDKTERESGKESEYNRTNSDREEAERIRQQAIKDADDIRQKAKDEAVQIQNKAKNEAIQIRNEVNGEVARIRDEENQKLKQEAQQKTQELIRKYMSSELDHNWAEFRRSMEAEDKARKDNLTRGEQERKEIWTRVSSMQGDMVKAMEDSVAHITRIKQDICKELGDWRSSLHVDQFDDITKAYSGLFRVHEEMNNLFSIVVSSELDEESKKGMADRIRRVRDNLSRIERQMDRALSVFGMYPIQPGKGEGFDNERHELTDKQQDEGNTSGEGYLILRCVTPGVALRYDEPAREDRILRKAKVEVDFPGQQE